MILDLQLQLQLLAFNLSLTVVTCMLNCTRCNYRELKSVYVYVYVCLCFCFCAEEVKVFFKRNHMFPLSCWECSFELLCLRRCKLRTGQTFLEENSRGPFSMGAFVILENDCSEHLKGDTGPCSN